MKRQTLAQVVRSARKRRGWTQEGLAEITGISRSTIANIEAGTTRLPKPEQMESFERHLGLSKEEMLRAAGRLNTVEDDVLVALQQIDRLATEEERLEVFRGLPDPVQRAVRKLAADFLSAATAELLEPNGRPVDQ